MRLRPNRHPRRESRLSGGSAARREPDARLDLSSITFTEEEILADVVYPGRAPGRAGPRR